MMKIVLTLCIAVVFQSICIAQTITNIDWGFRAKGDTVASFSNGTNIVVDTLNYRRGCIINKEDENTFLFLTNSTRKGSLLSVTTNFISTPNSQYPIELYSRTNSLNVLNKNNFKSLSFSNDYTNIYIDWNINTTFQSGNRIFVEAWNKNDPQVKKFPNYFINQPVNNVSILSIFSPLKTVYHNSKAQLLAVGYSRNATSIIPIAYNYSLSPIVEEHTFRKKELSPLTMQPFTPIAHSFYNSNLTHLILFGNLKGTQSYEHGYEIVILDTALNEIKRVRTDSTKMIFSNGTLHPTNIFAINDKIFVTGFIDFGNETKPFFTEHTLEGEFVQSKIVNTNATINSGSVSPDGKTVMMCGSVMNANDNKDFFVVAINTETGANTQQSWGDNRENELFDVLAISNDTAYVTGSEDKDFYAARLVNVQTMSVGEQTTFGNIEISPNPASAMCTITARNLIPTNSTMTIQNMQGQTVATIFEGIPSPTEVQNVSIDHLPTGAYFVTVQNGHTIHKTKFVIQK